MIIITNRIIATYVDPSNDIYDEFNKVIPRTSLFKTMIYSNIIIGLILSSLSFFFFMVDTDFGLLFLILSLAFLLPVVGTYKYDFISAVTFLLVSSFIAVLTVIAAVTITPFVLIYFVFFGFTIYTFIVDKQTRSSIKDSFNKDLILFYIILLAQYMYLVFASLINVEAFSNRGFSDFVIYYFIVLIISINLLFLHQLKYNARQLMFFTTVIFVIYSMIELQTNILSILAIIINLLTWIVLLFDKQSGKYFQKIDTEAYYLFRSIIILNAFSVLTLAIGFLYLYSVELNPLIIPIGGIVVGFYAYSIFKVEFRSLIWKHIFSVFLLLFAVTALILFETYASYSLLIIPIAVVTIFTLNFDYTTVNRFKKLERNTVKQLI